MTTDEEIEAAVKAMRAIRLRGGKVHDDVLRAYARAALQAAQLMQIYAEVRTHDAHARVPVRKLASSRRHNQTARIAAP
jgi:hypothetical protein